MQATMQAKVMGERGLVESTRRKQNRTGAGNTRPLSFSPLCLGHSLRYDPPRNNRVGDLELFACPVSTGSSGCWEAHTLWMGYWQ